MDPSFPGEDFVVLFATHSRAPSKHQDEHWSNRQDGGEAEARGLLVFEWEEEGDAVEQLASAYLVAGSDCTEVDAKMLRQALMTCLQCRS